MNILLDEAIVVEKKEGKRKNDEKLGSKTRKKKVEENLGHNDKNVIIFIGKSDKC